MTWWLFYWISLSVAAVLGFIIGHRFGEFKSLDRADIYEDGFEDQRREGLDR